VIKYQGKKRKMERKKPLSIYRKRSAGGRVLFNFLLALFFKWQIRVLPIPTTGIKAHPLSTPDAKCHFSRAFTHLFFKPIHPGTAC